ncbi:MAG: hypothetical protein WAU33_11345 [Candidatus Binataceae bacterium]
MPTKTTTKNSEGNVEPFNINDLPWKQFPYNHTDADCTFLTIGESKQDEVCYFPKTGKVRIRSTGDVLKTSRS